MVRHNGKWFWVSGLGVAFLTVSLWMMQGCSGKIPPIGAVLNPVVPLPTDVIANFENNKLTANSSLLGWNNGMVFRAATYGGLPAKPNTIVGPVLVPNTVADATDGSLYAIHVFATLNATGIGCGYEGDQLICPLYNGTTNSYFDASAFTGIQFMINIPCDDTNTNPVFQIAIPGTEPPPQYSGAAGGTCLVTGTCGGSCFNHFQVPLPANPGTGTGGWVTVTHPWSDFNLAFTPGPPLPLSSYVKQIIFMQWVFSNNQMGVTFPGPVTTITGAVTTGTLCAPIVSGGVTNISTQAVASPSTTTDFWVDNVQFLP